jgi:hypothetical protein
MGRISALTVIFTLCFLIVHRSTAAVITVGDPNQPATLPRLIADAYSQGARDIIINPGTYTIIGTGGSMFQLVGWNDAVIRANRVTLIADHIAGGLSLFELRHCTGVTLEGASLSQTAMTAYQGRIIAMGGDGNGKPTCDWKPDAGYPVPPADAKTFPFGPNVVDGQTRLLKLHNGDYGNEPMRALGDGTFRVTFHEPKLKFQVEDFLVGRFGDPNGKAPFKVHLIDCRDCTIKDITLSRNGFAAIREEGGGGNHFLQCTWAMGPRPAGATEDSVVTDAADGFHSTGTNPGPDIERCVMEGVFLDDCFAIHGGFQQITSVSGNRLTLGKGQSGVRVGEPVRVCGDKGFIEQANVIGLKNQPDHTVVITLDKPIDAPPGAKASNPLACGPGYKIIGCTLGNVRSRGILVKADNGLIKDNIIDGCVMSAVSVGPEYFWNEAGYVRNMTIEGNVFRNNGKRFADAAVLVHGEGVEGNQHIVIQRNQFLSNYGSCISINWADDITILENSITGPIGVAAGTLANPIQLANCNGINLRRNRFGDSAAFKMPLVKLGANVTDVANSDPAASTKP